MTYPLTGKLSAITQIYFDKFTDAKTDLGLADVFWGDQFKIPRTPTLCVEPDVKQQDYRNTNMFTQTFTIYGILYHHDVRSPQLNRRDVDLLAEQLEDLVHADRGLVDPVTNVKRIIEAHVSLIESGYNTKQNTMFRSARLTITGTSQSLLPASPG